jgi:endonuclease YncB( thermonuclease family)
MTQNVLSLSEYRRLTSDVKELIFSNRKKTQEIVKQQINLTYWQIGKRIEEEGLSSRAGYYNSILTDLSKDLEIDTTTLFRAVQFFQTFPQQSQIKDLSWSHFKYLLGVKDPDLRLELTNKAKEESLSLSKLTDEGNELRAGLQKENKKVSELKRPTNMDYTYRAEILNVIDGDTLLVNIDLGFNVNKEQRVRVGGINAQEIDTRKGKEAHFYLRSLLTNTNNVIIKTNKIDIYGRFVADVFYLEEETKNKRRTSSIFNNGVYLNAHLFACGFVDLL